MPKRRGKRRSPTVELWEATELLRDLATAVEWMLDTKPEAPTFDFERRRVIEHLEDVRQFVRDRDLMEEAADRAAEARQGL